MKKLLLLTLILTSCGLRYKEGDCLTPIDSSWSWYGKIAEVKGVGNNEDGHESYILMLDDRLGFFTKQLDDMTIKVTCNKK